MLTFKDFEEFLGREISDDEIKPALYLTMWKLQWELMQSVWAFLEKEDLLDKWIDSLETKDRRLITVNMSLATVFANLVTEYDLEKMPSKILMSEFIHMSNLYVKDIKKTLDS